MVEPDSKLRELQESSIVGEVKKSYSKYGYGYEIRDSCGGHLTVEVIEQVPLYHETDLAKMWAKLTDCIYGKLRPDIYSYDDERSDFQQLQISYNPPSGLKEGVQEFIRFGSNRRSVTRGYSYSRREYIPRSTRLLGNGKSITVTPMCGCWLRKRANRRVGQVATPGSYIYFVRHLLKLLPEDVQLMICPYFIDCPKGGDPKEEVKNTWKQQTADAV
ncbi:MAG: hypothetical protein U9N61_02160 [Euryarchaeota archaeon]|nr:hypothetical protein [Euryarchaeota archaeon]